MLLTIIAAAAAQTTPRGSYTPDKFMRLHPCPSTGKKTGACPGWVRDHIIPLCRGGPDTVANMQWQTKEDAAKKDKTECRVPAVPAARG